MIMITGHFDPFTDAHLDYFKQAGERKEFILCVVSSDRQAMEKKGKINIPASARKEICDLILDGLKLKHVTKINTWDRDNTTLANTLRRFKPKILLRGGDKTIHDMPESELEVCSELKIGIEHAEFRIDTHGSRMVL